MSKRKDSIKKSTGSVLPEARKIFGIMKVPMSEGSSAPGIQEKQRVDFSFMRMPDESVTGDFGHYRLTVIETNYAELSPEAGEFVPLPNYEACVVISMRAVEGVKLISEMYGKEYAYQPDNDGSGSYHAAMAFSGELSDVVEASCKVAAAIARISAETTTERLTRSKKAMEKLEKALKILDGDEYCAWAAIHIRQQLKNYREGVIRPEGLKIKTDPELSDAANLIADRTGSPLLGNTGTDGARYVLDSLVTYPKGIGGTTGSRG